MLLSRVTILVNFIAIGISASHVVPVNCTSAGEALCSSDPGCAAFGVLGNAIQLHGCVALTQNEQWSIFVRNGTGYSAVAGHSNINDSLCATAHGHEPRVPLY